MGNRSRPSTKCDTLAKTLHRIAGKFIITMIIKMIITTSIIAMVIFATWASLVVHSATLLLVKYDVMLKPILATSQLSDKK